MYPSPYKRSNSSSSIYYFKYIDPITKKRVLKSTGCIKKTDAAAFIKEFINDLNDYSSCSQLVLKNYIEPWLDPNKNPRFKRYKTEGKQYGQRHATDLAKLLKEHVIPDPISKMTISQITRGAALDFRSRLLECSLKKHPRVANKVISAIKSVFSEGIYRGELKYNPFTGIGDIKNNSR